MGKFDFSGWATRNDLLCGDGRTIKRNAFIDNDGETVPLVWNHQHNDANNVLGHALLENRDEGVYAYCTFNDTETGQAAKKLVKHGDVRSLSIYANKLKQVGGDVVHGCIRELSLVLAGANPGAYIDFVMAHSEDGSEELSGVEASYDENIMIHSDMEEEAQPDANKKETEMGAENNEEMTVGDVFDTLTEDQKTAVYAIIGEILDDEDDDEEYDEYDEGDYEDMKHNLFDNDREEDVLCHADMATIIDDGKRYGSLKESFLAHADEYGIEDIEWLFPEAKNEFNRPELIGRETDWVSKVMGAVSHSPFSRIKTMYADITEDEARAKGYIKGKLKKNEVFSLLKRTTQPTTIYKKQKIDRDDLIDITDFDAVAWIKQEMRLMLDEEIARAILVGDSRLASDDDKIDENCIRPVVNDADLFVIRWAVDDGSTGADLAKNFITAAIKSRKNYRGSGNPVLYTTEDMLTEMLLLEDTLGHKLYKTETELATALRVSSIVTVPVMENFEDADGKDVYGIIVNLKDYKVGADKGGAINMFDDFDIDYNQQKYLMETRCSGSLIKPFSAIVLREGSATASEEPTMSQAMNEFKR